MIEITLNLLRRAQSSNAAGIALGSLLVPVLLLAFAGYSLIEFVDTYLLTMLVAVTLLWVTGQLPLSRVKTRR